MTITIKIAKTELITKFLQIIIINFGRIRRKNKVYNIPITKEEFLAMLSETVKTCIQNEPLQYNITIKSQNMKPIEFTNRNIYHGQWNQNFEMDGYGKYYLKDERILAEGIWKKGELK